MTDSPEPLSALDVIVRGLRTRWTMWAETEDEDPMPLASALADDLAASERPPVDPLRANLASAADWLDAIIGRGSPTVTELRALVGGIRAALASPATPRPEGLPVGAILASALMAANYPGDSGEDVDRLIDELAKRGYTLARLSDTRERP